MRCDISSHDVHDDPAKLKKCLNQILRMKLGSQTFPKGMTALLPKRSMS
ncbi:MAG: hypothetical protein ACLU99_01940 [Alphaproteobacteria bacterium]